jgi:hypothetical protein
MVLAIVKLGPEEKLIKESVRTGRVAACYCVPAEKIEFEYL